MFLLFLALPVDEERELFEGTRSRTCWESPRIDLHVSHSGCCIPAGPHVDIAGWKWEGAMVMGPVTQYCFTPDSREACGVLVMFPIWWHFKASSLIQSVISWCQSISSCVLNSVQCISSAQRDDGCQCTAVWCRMERNRRVRAAQWDCCAGERACFHCGGMCLLSFKYPSHFGGVFHFVWTGCWVSAAVCSLLRAA